MVNRVSERPPWSKTRGEASWGGHLAGTAENSGPDPKPIKINGKAPTSCRNTWHRAPPDTAHLWLSLGKLHVPTQCVSPWDGTWKLMAGLAGSAPRAARSPSASLQGPGVLLQATTATPSLHAPTLTCNISSPSPCSDHGGLGLVMCQVSAGWPERAPLSPCLCLQTCFSVARGKVFCRIGMGRACWELRGTEAAEEVSCREVSAALFVEGDFLSKVCHSFQNVRSFGFRQRVIGLMARHGFINCFKSIFVLTLYTVQEDGFGHQETWVLFLAPPQTQCVTLGEEGWSCGQGAVEGLGRARFYFQCSLQTSCATLDLCHLIFPGP